MTYSSKQNANDIDNIKKEELRKLYLLIQKCDKCKPDMDTEKALRDINKTNYNADVFIISQTLAKDAVRKSGVNFYKPDGTFGNTGRLLNKFLVMFDRTIEPSSPKCVYNTEMAQCYPGKNINGKGDRKPTKKEIAYCQQYLIRELEIIKPKLILLMGKSSRDGFYRYFLNGKECPPFSQHVGNVDYYKDIPVIPIQHASGSNPRYPQMLKNPSIIKKIKEILNK